MAEKFLEERFKKASVFPFWLQVEPATAHEPCATEKACRWSWRELKSLGNTSATCWRATKNLKLSAGVYRSKKNRLHSRILMPG